MATSDSWASIARDMFPEDGNDHAVAFFFISYLCIGTVCARAPRFASHRPRAAVYAAARMLTGCWMHVACTLWHMLCMHASCGTCCSAISTELCSHTDAQCCMPMACQIVLLNVVVAVLLDVRPPHASVPSPAPLRAHALLLPLLRLRAQAR